MSPVVASDLLWILSSMMAPSDGAPAGGGEDGSETELDGTLGQVFYTVAAQEAGGSDVIRFQKVFAKNKNATTPLTASKVWIQAQEHAGQIQIGLASSLDDTKSIPNPLTAPSDIVFADAPSEGAAIDVANSGSLTAGSAQGVWLKQTIPAGTQADASVPATLRLKGQTAGS